MADVVQAPGQGAPPPPVNGKPVNGVTPPAAAKPPPAPVIDVDPYEDLLKNKPISVKNRAGKSVTITDRKALEHYISKGFGASEAFEKSNRLEQELKQTQDLIAQIEAGDEGSVDMLRKALGPKWRQIVEKEALRDFEEEERMKGVPPHIREKLEEARALKAEKDERTQRDARAKAQQEHAQRTEQLKQTQAEVERIGIPALQKLGFTAKPPPAVIQRLAACMAENIDLATERGISELPVEIVAEAVKADMQAEYKQLAASFVSAGDGAGLVSWLGDDVVNVIRKFDLARLRGAAGGGGAPPPPAPGTREGGVDAAEAKKFWR